MFNKLDEISNFDLGYSKEEWVGILRTLTEFILQDSNDEQYINKETVFQGSKLRVELKEGVLKLDYETCICNTLECEFDVYLNIVSHSGKIVKNGDVISN